MAEISRSVVKLDHGRKVRGEAVYVADHPMEDILYGKLLRSNRARARVLDIKPPALPEGYSMTCCRDVPGENQVLIIEADTPVFVAIGEVAEFVGDPIALVAGPEEAEVERILAEIQVEYEDLPPVLDVRQSKDKFFDCQCERGDVDRAFQEADQVFQEVFQTGLQEHGYLETQGLIAIPGAGKMTVRGSIQCPYYIHKALVFALGMEKEKVQVIQDVTGGGFGGKEDYPSILACQVAVAARKAGKPVRVIYDRREDMAYTSKRHPCETSYKAAVKDGKVTAMDVTVLYDAGAYTTMSKVVLQRGVICATGVYNIPNLRIRGRAMKTNTVPNGAFRGFGAPQTFFGIEMMMAHLAQALGEDPLAFKTAHLVQKGDPTSTSGKYHFPVPLREMSKKLTEAADYWNKRKAYAKQQGRYRRGIGASYSFHGAGFTGGDVNKAKVKLKRYPDGKVEVLTAGAEMGQGILTAFAKIAAKEMDMPLEQIIITLPDTDRVPDSGPTVASRSTMVVGELIRRAAAELKADGQLQEAQAEYEEPKSFHKIPFDKIAFKGDAYPTYSWGAHCVELEVDTLTGEHKVLGAWGCYDVGTPIDMTVIVGQMEGGLLQGIGYSHMEEMRYNKKGEIRSNSYSDYTMPTSADVPNMGVMIHVEEYPEGPYGAKGAGELPVVGVPGAYISALEQALGSKIGHIPFSMEDTINRLKEGSSL